MSVWQLFTFVNNLLGKEKMEFACCLVLQCSPSCVLCPVLPDCSFQAKCNKYFCPELHRGSIDPSSITCNLCVVYLTSMECSGFGAHKSMLVNHVIQGGKHCSAGTSLGLSKSRDVRSAPAGHLPWPGRGNLLFCHLWMSQPCSWLWACMAL